MESRGPEDSKNVKTSQAYFFEGFISFFEDFSLTIWIPLDCRERSSGSLTHCGTQSTCCHFHRDENGQRIK